MAAIYKGTLGLIGNTPLVEPMNLEKELGLEATILLSLNLLPETQESDLHQSQQRRGTEQFLPCQRP